MGRFPFLAVSVVTAVAVCGLVAGAGPATGATPAAVGHLAAVATAGNSWGTAQEVPGLAALNAGGDAEVSSVSCTSAGNCAAGGYYTGSSHDPHAFVADQTGGSWGTAQQVPGSADLNAGGFAEIFSVSCASAGNCAAGGWYADPSGRMQAFVVDEAGGSWGTAQPLPGSIALNTGDEAEVLSVSCASAGNCVAGGWYIDSSNHQQAFVADEAGGSWGPAQPLPGSIALNTSGEAQVYTVSCASAGNCAAGGWYSDSPGHHQAFVADEAGGSWGVAQQVPGTAALNVGSGAAVNSVSCASPGNCAAGGFYADAPNAHLQAFVADETGGSWGTAQEVPGSGVLNPAGYGAVNSVSCVSAGNCAAAGFVYSSQAQAFAADETGGSWGTAQEVAGSTTPINGNYGFYNAGVNSVSCTSVGNCAAGGYYPDSSGHREALVVGETGGSWSAAQEVPGSATLNTGGDAAVNSVSCAQTGYCAAGGYFKDAFNRTHAFVVNERQATSTSMSLSAATVSYGHEQAERLSVTVRSQDGTPGGTVTVSSGAATACTITLSSGIGSCTLPATRFPAGIAHLTASYAGSAMFAASTSPAAALTVARAASKTTLTLSAATVTYGREQAEHLTVHVTPAYSGIPGGKVSVKTGTVTVCVITLASGRGSCTLTARQLPAGIHTLVAAYPGSSDFTGSTSGRHTLTVVR